MPLYEYQCAQCHSKIEVIQRVSDPPQTHCPKCGGDMKKVISAPAIQFKGSGFYKTDYASSKPSESKSESTKSESTPSESKTETKSEPKSESTRSE